MQAAGNGRGSARPTQPSNCPPTAPIEGQENQLLAGDSRTKKGVGRVVVARLLRHLTPLRSLRTREPAAPEGPSADGLMPTVHRSTRRLRHPGAGGEVRAVL